MARGKKTDFKVRQEALARLAVTDNVSQVARDMKLPDSTVRQFIIDEEKKDDGFKKLREQKKKEFVDKAWEIIQTGQDILLRDLKKAKENGIPVDISKISTVIGTIYDKQALANNESTMNLGGETFEKFLKQVEGSSDY